MRYSIDGRYVQLPDVRSLARATMIDMLAVVWMDVVGGNGAVFDPLAEQQGPHPLPHRRAGVDLALGVPGD